MRKIFLCMALAALLLAAAISCARHEAPLKTVDSREALSSYSEKLFSVTPMDESVQVGLHSVMILPKDEGMTYTLSGYYNGQVVVGTKNTIVKLENAYLENTSGQAALKCEAKIEVSSVRGSKNYIVSRGRGFAAKGALQARRGLVLGGSGELYINGAMCHGIEAQEVKIKGSGTLMVQGTKRGSALCCDFLTVEPEKSFTAYFINAKNGIKADVAMEISSGTFYLYDNDIALKTDTKEESPYATHGIALKGGVFHTHGNGALYKTESGMFVDSGAIFVEE